MVFFTEILQSIISAFKDPSFEAFHLKGFTQLWKPSPDKPVEEIYGEAYTSKIFREMEREVQSMKPPGETLESVVVPIMAYSDSTHLTNFGTAALWPIYFFIGLIFKQSLHLFQHTILRIFHQYVTYPIYYNLY